MALVAMIALSLISTFDLLVTPDAAYTVPQVVAQLLVYWTWPLCVLLPRIGAAVGLVVCSLAVPILGGIGVPFVAAMVALGSVAATSALPWVVSFGALYWVWAAWAVYFLGAASEERWGAWLLLFIAAGLGALLRFLFHRFFRAQRLLRESEARHEAIRRQTQLAIARDLHDVIGYELTLISLTTSQLRNEKDVAVLQSAVADMGRISRSALFELREMLRLLRSGDDVRTESVSPAGFPETIDQLIEGARGAGLDVRANLDLDGWEDVRSAVRVSMIRILQESLTNVLKHGPSGARCDVDISMAVPISMVVLSDHEAQAKAKGLYPGVSGNGVIGMEERVEVLGGKLRVGQEAGHWAVRVQIPL